MNWKKNKFTVIKKAISPEMAELFKNYLLLKRKVTQTFITTKHISEFNMDWGTWRDKQVPGTYSHYADVLMETLLTSLKPKMEKTTGLKLFENYSYTRIYKVKDILERHKDRFSCEISTTLNLGGDKPWPIYINPNEKEVRELFVELFNSDDFEVWIITRRYGPENFNKGIGNEHTTVDDFLKFVIIKLRCCNHTIENRILSNYMGAVQL